MMDVDMDVRIDASVGLPGDATENATGGIVGTFFLNKCGGTPSLGPMVVALVVIVVVVGAEVLLVTLAE